jgi:hypothetical protein
MSRYASSLWKRPRSSPSKALFESARILVLRIWFTSTCRLAHGGVHIVTGTAPAPLGGRTFTGLHPVNG